ncbi:MAG: hypothetical protein UR66_C0003G0156 [Candidatus Moranbacteria bacterium GW2011_GWE1_35_17]|nr:MAG: hypothetical protein UR66_C0003G0156 [Candidatus Moranbacteria bacterium GW2011_GWE1_35_17]KKP72513.1 MAG: hypothetical protein UR65_C0014G0026 [Candidatus Moranbacteria bacterium GW2011_GWE2_35_164]KKP84210.1 MAG: hypothetical protein UR83_C0025G0013 [Candidatus Moranbacteria bacterium GW2011_GWF2_35_54]
MLYIVIPEDRFSKRVCELLENHLCGISVLKNEIPHK